MQQRDRRTAPAQKTARDRTRTRRRQSREDLPAAAALEALLSGAGTEKIPARGVLSLSHAVGNAALLEILSLNAREPETAPETMPQGALGTAPLQAPGGSPSLTQTPAFAAFSPMGEASPLMT